ncbi:LppP/LprE family lipoprotein [Mycobacterium deserti]|uniref:LppP/LprE family lipoprotein n=1 Tax=Mycobacterium deserti TaxID=2978347 RepID=A0ABT2MDJ9_9MYCO|nr:LppP/LprE family lipoprotein [Mycobacterium deserti]MCT7660338.1 LppP/LprE family lipoprotein [Mycobacterium deserti]
MRRIGIIAAVLLCALFCVGCGWSPPSASPTTSVACTPADGPTADAISDEINRLPAGQWREASRGHAADCRLHWVVVAGGDASDSPQQVLFFDRSTPIGTPTPEPRPYITVTPTGNDNATVQYQWRQGQEPACCPTGIGQARFSIEDGKLKALDPIPNS